MIDAGIGLALTAVVSGIVWVFWGQEEVIPAATFGMLATLILRPGNSLSSMSIVTVSLAAGAMGATPDAVTVTIASASASASIAALSPPSAISSSPVVAAVPTEKNA